VDQWTKDKLRGYAVDEQVDKKRARDFKRLYCEDWLAEHILNHYDVDSYTDSDLNEIIDTERAKLGERG